MKSAVFSVHCLDTLYLCCGTEGMSPSGVVPKRLLPYESELGASVTKESLVLYVCHMEKRPVIPQHWQLLPQVLLDQVLLIFTYRLCMG